MSLGTGCLPHLYPYSTNSCSQGWLLSAITAHFVHITDGRLKKTARRSQDPMRFHVIGMYYMGCCTATQAQVMLQVSLC